MLSKLSFSATFTFTLIFSGTLAAAPVDAICNSCVANRPTQPDAPSSASCPDCCTMNFDWLDGPRIETGNGARQQICGPQSRRFGCQVFIPSMEPPHDLIAFPGFICVEYVCHGDPITVTEDAIWLCDPDTGATTSQSQACLETHGQYQSTWDTHRNLEIEVTDQSDCVIWHSAPPCGPQLT